MIPLRDDYKPKITFELDEGTKKITKEATEVGYAKVATYTQAVEEGNVLTVSDKGNYMAKKAKTGDIVLGLALHAPDPYIDQEYRRADVEIIGELYRLPLLAANTAIKPGDAVSLGVGGADKKTDGEFISLEKMSANDSNLYIEVFKPFNTTPL